MSNLLACALFTLISVLVVLQLKVLRALRVVRAVRPLRLISRFPQLQLIVRAIGQAIPASFDVFVVAFFIMYTIAIIGQQAFGGAMSRCTDSSISSFAECVGTFNTTGLECGFQPTETLEMACKMNPLGAPFPRLWMPFPTESGVPGESFDDLPRSLLSVFGLLTGACVMINTCCIRSTSLHISLPAI